MENAQRIQEAQQFGSQDADNYADRFLINYSESGVGNGYSRTYKLDNNARQTLITAQAFGHYFGKSVQISIAGPNSTNERKLALLPNRKILNNGHKLTDEQTGQVLATIDKAPKGQWKLIDATGRLCAETSHSLPKLEKFVNSLDDGSNKEQQYALLCDGEFLAHARDTSVYVDPVAALAAEKSPDKPNGILSWLRGSPATRKHDAIAIAFINEENQPLDDAQLMALMMVHHEYNICRRG